MRFLLSKGADPNLSDDRGETPLITAVYGLSLESVLALLDAKADPYLETKSGISPTVLAADLCSLPILKLLKNAGVEFQSTYKKRIFTDLYRSGKVQSRIYRILSKLWIYDRSPHR
ncbi:ankyrin repeat protein [Leptospira interrogans str. L1207]|nr:ankyrin repeat protein [Leptospira interrogans str. L1207]